MFKLRETFNILYLTILFSIILYAPKIGFLESNIFVFIGLLIFLIIFKKNPLFPLTKHTYILTLLLGIIICISILSSFTFGLFNTEISLYYFLKHVKVLIYFFLIYFIIFNMHYTVQNVLRSLIYTILIHIFVTYLMLLVPDSRDVIMNFVGFIPDYPVLYRVSSLSSGYDSAALISLFGMSITSYYIYHFQNSNYKKLIFLNILFFTTLIFTARTGIVLGILFILFNLLIMTKINNYIIKTINLKIIFTTITLFIVLFFTVIYLINSSDNEIIMYGLLRSFGFENSIESQNQVLSTFEFDLSYILVGTGFEPYSKFAPGSDMGYMQYLTGAGLFGVASTITFYIYSWYILYKSRNITMNMKPIINIYSFLILFILIGSFKGPYLFARQSLEITFIILSLGLREIYINKHRLRLSL